MLIFGAKFNDQKPKLSINAKTPKIDISSRVAKMNKRVHKPCTRNRIKYSDNMSFVSKNWRWLRHGAVNMGRVFKSWTSIALKSLLLSKLVKCEDESIL